jgi:hypothetical protein
MTNSQRKGSSGEREAAAYLCTLGFDAVRSKGLGVEDGRDVIVRDLPNVYLEVKRDEKVDVGTRALLDAWEQAFNKTIATVGTRTTRLGFCAVLWRRNGQREWKLTLQDEKCGLVTVWGDSDIRANLKMLNEIGGGK